MQSDYLDTLKTFASECETEDTIDIGDKTQKQETFSAMGDGSQDNNALEPGIHNKYKQIREHKER